MSRFAFREKTLEIREQSVKIRELSADQRNEFLEARQADPKLGGSVLLAHGCVEPKMTAEEWATEPPAVREELIEEISALSVRRKPVEGGAEKESDAR